MSHDKPETGGAAKEDADLHAVVAHNTEQTPSVISKELHTQIQGVIDGNNRTEFLLMGGTAVLFLLGAGAVIVALASGQYIWTLPSAGISAFLYWPYLRIEKLRNRNIALVSAAALISNLPPAESAKEIQKLIEKLFQEEK
ncbi:hypothetical protein [Pseudophaeobacter sp. A-200-2]|uniref:hypothetical protein n=1 Tax=Pseudophaeobacter sp. A-200-2 TaxID=3098145 RepID=UPI0034D7288B